MNVENSTSDLYLHKLESYPQFLRNPENVGMRGVYIWGFCFVDTNTASTSDFIPYYVGKHRSNIYRRIQEHFYGLRHGTHKIIYSKWLNNSCLYDSQNPKHHAFLNTDDKKRKKTSLPSDELLDLMPHINNYVDNFYVTYISVNHLGLSENDENIYIDRLERYIQEIIGSKSLSCRSGVKLPDSFRPTIVPNNETIHILKIYPLT